MRTSIILAVAFAIVACQGAPPAAEPSRAATVRSHGAVPYMTAYLCPEPDPAQPNCKVKP